MGLAQPMFVSWPEGLSVLAGAVVAAGVIRDIFHTLWHPQGFGGLTRGVFAVVWWVTRRVRWARVHELTGPLALLLTVIVWTVLVVIAWTLFYLPFMPEGFYFSSSLKPAQSSDLVASVYLSLVAVATLGLGDIMPADPVLRMLVPLQALIGFVLLTAAISWVLQVYPALSRRRALARHLTILQATEAASVVREGEASIAVQLLTSVHGELGIVEMDVLQHAETYFFRERDPDVSLPAAAPVVEELVEAGRQHERFEVRHAAEALNQALASLAGTLDRGHLRHGGSTREILRAYAADHQQEPAAR